MTEVVAAACDAHKSGDAAAADTRGDDTCVGDGGRELHIHGFLALLGGGHELRERLVGVRAGHYVGVMMLQEIRLHPLGHAAQHTDERSSAVGAAQSGQRVETIVHLLLGTSAHGACVEKYGVGLLERRSRIVARLLHHGGYHFAVSHIHLAAVSFDKKLLHIACNKPRCLSQRGHDNVRKVTKYKRHHPAAHLKAAGGCYDIDKCPPSGEINHQRGYSSNA